MKFQSSDESVNPELLNVSTSLNYNETSEGIHPNKCTLDPEIPKCQVNKVYNVIHPIERCTVLILRPLESNTQLQLHIK